MGDEEEARRDFEKAKAEIEAESKQAEKDWEKEKKTIE